MVNTAVSTAVTPEAARGELIRAHAAATQQVGQQREAAPPGAFPAPTDPLGISASYFTFRRGLAILGLALPVVLIVGVGLGDIQTSLSAYYHFAAAAPLEAGAGTMRNVFVGILWAIGTFLYLYKGYSAAEDLALDIADVAALGVSLFPMDWPMVPDAARSLTAVVHYTSAMTFFVLTAYVCVFRAKDTLPILGDAALERRFRRIYAGLGGVMVGVPAIVLLMHFASNRAAKSYAVLVLEVVGVVVFSVYWLVKSREVSLIEQGETRQGQTKT